MASIFGDAFRTRGHFDIPTLLGCAFSNCHYKDDTLRSETQPPEPHSSEAPLIATSDSMEFEQPEMCNGKTNYEVAISKVHPRFRFRRSQLRHMC